MDVILRVFRDIVIDNMTDAGDVESPRGAIGFDDPADIRQKSHVEHAIDFIEHQNCDVAKMERALLEMIEQAARRGDDDIDAAFQFLALLAVANAAVDHGRAQIGKASIVAKGGLDLRSELSRRLQDQTTKFPVMSEQRQNRKREGSGFSGTGLGGADQILAGENNGEGAKLDWGGLSEAHRLHTAHHFGRKVEIIETHGEETSACRSACHSVPRLPF